MTNILKCLIHLFYPETCINCNKHLLKTEELLCIHCRHEIKLVTVNNYTKNKISTLFYGFTKINIAISFLYFEKEGITKKLIHELKYRNNQRIGVFLGDWFGHLLKKNNVLTNIDYIVPVPLHPKKLKKRGYNQLTKFGNTLSQILGVKFDHNSLQKISISETQTFKSRFDRFSSTKTKFYLNNITIFKNKHILLIDDVITTGATLKACCQELEKTENINISIATIAFTKKLT